MYISNHLTEASEASSYLLILKWYHLKLVRALFNYYVLGTNTAAIFLSNDHSLYAPIYLGCMPCLISFEWHQSTCQGRVESEKKKQNEKFLLTVGLEPTALRSWSLMLYQLR